MSVVLRRGFVRSGRIELNELIDLPDGSEVTVIGSTPGPREEDRPMNPDEIARTLAAMSKIEPLEISKDEQSLATSWEKSLNDYSIRNMDQGLEDVFR